MGDTANWIGIGISASSGVVAIIALCKSSSAQKRAIDAQRQATEAQNRIVEIEEAREKDRSLAKKKALLVASLIREQTGQVRRHSAPRTRDLLRIENRGDGSAHNIVVIVDNKPVLKHPAIGHTSVRHVNPEEITKIGPQPSQFQYLLALSRECVPPFDVRITWDDDSGEPGEYETVVST
ncbi:MAG: hypothetical protein GWP08_18145 [Nitrospiraceae bacterium]|nr:hypothetical protein [Nitrospiraceae bacterium]